MLLDDEAIPDSEVVYRRIAREGDTNMTVVDEGTGERRVRSGAFSMDADGCSVYLESVLSSDRLGPADLIRAPQNAIISVTAGEVRKVQLGVAPDPWPSDSDGHRRDAAHALIVKSCDIGSTKLKKAFRALARTAEFVVN